ncbi:hypothetical protein [Streptomyces swartbergensis]|uniref:Uncharacterized protein n=1 Tax=Streptomyces swartbergensis TaxID=487165 RepID=A0A243QS58_9ACTN|nr:hypothetical protein [Streptomyces swartbergensis]OUC84904.1 hypothetical protein CA983_42145 [Streptomyces swartbergensis]
MPFEKIRIEDYPHPVGTLMRTRTGGVRAVVADAHEFAFLACCTAHHSRGLVAGHYPEVQGGRFVGPEKPIARPTDDDRDCPRFGRQ